MSNLEDIKFVTIPIIGMVAGNSILPGEVLEEGDYYYSSSGNWQPCPCPGAVLGEGTTCKWVRPIKQ